ncbi:MAG: nuclear transport factor 2 family protein [Cyclobacteriaceae bacterium]
MNNVKYLKSLYAAFGRGDMPAVMEGMHPKMVWHEAEGNPYAKSSGEPFNGPDEVLNKLFMRLNDEWDDFTVTPEKFHDAGDTIIVEGRYTGTYKETGRAQDSPFCHIWHMKDEKFSEFQQYTNTAALQEVMGVAHAV